MSNTDLTPVYLNYYDDGSYFSKVLHTFGIGIYHYSIIVYAKEYGLLSHPFYLCGIYTLSYDDNSKDKPKKSTNKFNGALKLRERYQVGLTELSNENISTIVKRLSSTFTGPYFRSIEFARKLLKILCGSKLNNIPWNFESFEWFSRSCCMCYPCAFSEDEIVIKETLTYLFFKHRGDISLIMYELSEVSTERMSKFRSKIDSMVKSGLLPKLQMYEEEASIKMLDLSHPSRKLADFSFSEMLDTYTVIVTSDFIKEHAINQIKQTRTSLEQQEDKQNGDVKRFPFDDEKDNRGSSTLSKTEKPKRTLFSCFGRCCRKKYDKSKSFSYSFNSNSRNQTDKYSALRLKRAKRHKRILRKN